MPQSALTLPASSITARAFPAMLAVVLTSLLAGTSPVGAGPIVEPWTNMYGWGLRIPPRDEFSLLSPYGGVLTFALNNAGATMETNEPNEGGVLTHSLWGHLTPAQPTRVVMHTVGSDVDTVLAVYTGSALNALTKVTSNDNFTGVSPGRSLVQFDARAGETHGVQVGSVGPQTGDIALNVAQFAPEGGLSAFLAVLTDSFGGGSFAIKGRDYTCATTTCPSPTFVLHNSRDQTMEVVVSTTFGALFNAPGPVALAAGSAASVTLPAVAIADSSTTRTLTGEFTFSGRVNGVEVSRATYPGTVFVRGSAPETTLQAAALPTSRAGALSRTLTAFATVINAGTRPAIGCVVRSRNASAFNVTFQETDSATNAPVGAANVPVNIPAGSARSFVFSIASQGPELGDPTTDGPVSFQCANAFPASQNLANGFALTALGTVFLADMISIGATPTNDGTINVPSATGGAFGVATVNIGVAATVTARPIYAHPFGEDAADKQFRAFICETGAAGTCLDPPAASVPFTAAPNVPRTFAVFVQRPPVDPGFDPGQRRIFVKFEQPSPPSFLGQNPIPLLVGSTSVAVRAQ